MIELDELKSVDVEKISPEQIVSNFLDKEKTLLYIGNHNNLENELNASKCKKIDQKNVDQIEDVSEKYDYILLTEILETIDDPQRLIVKIKNLAEVVIIYEYKFDEGCYTNNNWNKPWTKVGLENFLCREFDYINNIFLGYSTIYICKYPNNNNSTSMTVS